jgi:hypothetical protein
METPWTEIMSTLDPAGASRKPGEAVTRRIDGGVKPTGRKLLL